jgi:two-component system, response regulator
MNPNPILLVEDNPDDVLLAKRALKKCGIGNAVIVASDGIEALEYLFGDGKSREAGPRPSVILLDLKLPRLDGMEFLERIKADEGTRALPVVILTSSNYERDVNRSTDLGADVYLQKPVDPALLKQALNQVGL